MPRRICLACDSWEPVLRSIVCESPLCSDVGLPWREEESLCTLILSVDPPSPFQPGQQGSRTGSRTVSRTSFDPVKEDDGFSVSGHYLDSSLPTCRQWHRDTGWAPQAQPVPANPDCPQAPQTERFEAASQTSELKSCLLGSPPPSIQPPALRNIVCEILLLLD